MTWEEIVGLLLALLLMGVGTLGAMLPALPSTPLVLLAAVLHKLWFGDSGASWLVLAVLAVLAGLSLLMDYLATFYGAQRLGATWRGAVGAMVGLLLGAFLALPGIILGPFVGAVSLEMLGGRKFEDATRAGVGAIIGLLAGAVGKLACCVAMSGLFAVNVIWRSVG